MTIEYRAATEEQKAVIEGLLAAPFPATLETIAARLNLTPLAAAQLLGRDMCAFVTGDVAERFDEVWESLAQWERATLFIQHGGHVFEIEAKLSAGKRAQGYYNILHKNAVAGDVIVSLNTAVSPIVPVPENSTSPTSRLERLLHSFRASSFIRSVFSDGTIFPSFISRIVI